MRDILDKLDVVFINTSRLKSFNDITDSLLDDMEGKADLSNFRALTYAIDQDVKNLNKLINEIYKELGGNVWIKNQITDQTKN